MKCCVILHNMMVEDQGDVCDGIGGNEAVLHVRADIDKCFVRDEAPANPPGSFATI